MKEYVIIRRSYYDKLDKFDNEPILSKEKNNNEIPDELKIFLDHNRINNENIDVRRSNQNLKFSTDQSTQTVQSLKENEIKSSATGSDIKNEIKASRIIPIYVNTIPKVHREKATEILEDLVNRKVIYIDSDGFITKPGMEDGMVTFEEFLRAIMIKNASIGTNGLLLREIALEMNPNDIRNQKVLTLIGHGNIDKNKNNITWMR